MYTPAKLRALLPKIMDFYEKNKIDSDFILQEGFRLKLIVLENVPADKRNRFAYLSALKHSGVQTYLCYENIPPEIIDEELAIEMAKNCLYKKIPSSKRTYSAHLWYIRRGGNISKVPLDQRTQEMYEALVESVGSEIVNVPVEKRSLRICRNAIKDYKHALASVPDEYLTPEFCLEAVKSFGAALLHVPEEIVRSCPDILKIAVKNDPWVLEKLPPYLMDLLTFEIYLDAVKVNAKILKIVPFEKFSESEQDKLIDAAAKSYETNDYLKYIPIHKITKKRCFDAIKNSRWNIKHFPANLLLDAEIQRKIQKIARKQKERELLLAPVNEDPDALECPSEVMSEELCAVAVGEEAIKSFASKLINELCKVIPTKKPTDGFDEAAITILHYYKSPFRQKNYQL